MNEEWWESPTCLICDYWWAFLAGIVLLLSAYFTRAYWLPEGVDLCFTGKADTPLKEAIPPQLKGVDVLFAFDQTGSMGFMIDGAKEDALKLMQAVSARWGTEHFGLAGF